MNDKFTDLANRKGHSIPQRIIKNAKSITDIYIYNMFIYLHIYKSTYLYICIFIYLYVYTLEKENVNWATHRTVSTALMCDFSCSDYLFHFF